MLGLRLDTTDKEIGGVMPLTKSGKKTLEEMIKEYGKKKGTSIFYASINKKKKGSSKWHGKGGGKKWSGSREL